jgi:EmrB/QacA subfamily drug resistance transporter
MENKRWTLVAICTATFMLLLDITIVQVALPQIQDDLHVSISGLQWVVDAYALPLAALIVSLGILADRWGRKLVFLSGVTVFTIASAICGLAPNLATLSAGRALQGVGGAGMFATALALIGQEFQGAERGRAIAAWGSSVGGGVAAGPLIGGLLIKAADWPWIFYVNLPVGAFCVALTIRHVAESRDPNPRRLDLPSLVTLSGGLLAVTAGMLRSESHSWSSSAVLAPIIAGVVLLAVFVVLQRRPDALFDRTLFRSKPFDGLSFATFTLGSGMFAMFLFLTIYLQNVLDYSPLQGGLRMLPVTAQVFIIPFVMRRIGISPVDGYVVGTGLAIVAAGLALMTLANESTSWLYLLPGLLLCGLGIGIANPSIAATALAVVPPTRSGLAAGVSNTMRLAGVAVGTAALGAILQAGVKHTLHGASHVTAATVSAGQIHAVKAVSVSTAGHAFSVGLHWIFVVSAVWIALGSLACFVYVGRMRQAATPAPQAAAQSASS